MNKHFMSGNLTRDVELKDVGTTKVAKFGIAINRNYKTKEGEWKSEVVFVDCEAWDSGAERLAQNYRKGSKIFVETTLCQHNWETPDGQKRSKLVFRVEHFEPGAQRTQKESNGESEGETTINFTKAKQAKSTVEQTDEIPF